MGRYNSLSTQPRQGASSFVSQLISGTLSFAGSETLASASTASTLTSAGTKKCFFCPKTFTNDSIRRQHIDNSPECLAAQHAVLEKATASRAAKRQESSAMEGGLGQQSARLDTPNAPAPAAKRRRVTIEE
ncbi:hypothetical protein FRC07_001885, partial [Ceratobasidium sp. 392]